MPNQGSPTYNPSTSTQSLPSGYYSGGTINPVTGTATASQVLSGQTFASASGIGQTGTMPNKGTLRTVTPGVYSAGYYSAVYIPGWTALANDTTARYYLAAAYDSSANLTYAIDGYNVSGYSIATLTAYSHSSNSWTALANDTTARQQLAAAYDSSANLTYAIDGYYGGALATLTAYLY